jgi:hypothetical protein
MNNSTAARDAATIDDLRSTLREVCAVLESLSERIEQVHRQAGHGGYPTGTPTNRPPPCTRLAVGRDEGTR